MIYNYLHSTLPKESLDILHSGTMESCRSLADELPQHRFCCLLHLMIALILKRDIGYIS